MDRLGIIDTESRRFAEVLAATPSGVRVPTCPDWDAGDLLWHLVDVQAFWAAVLGADARTDEDVQQVEASLPHRPPTTEELLALRERATSALLEQLAGLDDDQLRWSWFAADQTVGFTRRMQTYEAAMHRVDAELTAGLDVSPVGPDVAAGALDHCLDVMWRLVPEWGLEESLAVVELRAEDTGDRWLVEVGHWTGTGPESGKQFDEPWARPARAGDATGRVTGAVEDLALWAWVRGGTVSVTGDGPAVAALDALVAHGIQ